MSGREAAEIRKCSGRGQRAERRRYTEKRRESGIRFPALFLTLTFCLARPYLFGLYLRAVLALVRVGPVTKGHDPVELVTGNGTVQ
jgi:hypothetical protein